MSTTLTSIADDFLNSYKEMHAAHEKLKRELKIPKSKVKLTEMQAKIMRELRTKALLKALRSKHVQNCTQEELQMKQELDNEMKEFIRDTNYYNRQNR